MWYVLQVNTGEELRVRDSILHIGYPALVPREERLVRKGGNWESKEYVLFPGYVFVSLTYNAGSYYQIRPLTGVLRFLGSPGEPSPLSYLEAEWIRVLSGTDGQPLRPSRVTVQKDGSFQIEDGVLRSFGTRILGADPRTKRASVEISLCGESKIIQLSIEPTQNNRIPEETGG